LINDLIIDIIQKAGSAFNDIVTIFLLVIALQWFIRFDILALGSIISSISEINKKIKPLNSFVSDNIKKIHMMFTLRTNKHVRSAWIAFYNEYTKKGIRVDGASIRDYFNIQSVISVPGARKKAEAVPGIITALGIIASFISAFAKIVENNSNGGGAQQLFDSIIPSFSIVFVAFFISLIYQILDRYIYHSAVSSMQTFIGYIEQKIAPVSGDLSGFDSSDTQEQTKAVCTALETFLAPSIETISEMQLKISSMLAKTQSEGVQQMVDAFVEKLGEATKDQFEAFTQSMKQQLDTMTKSTT
jgi:hypothetical protein